MCIRLVGWLDDSLFKDPLSPPIPLRALVWLERQPTVWAILVLHPLLATVAEQEVTLGTVVDLPIHFLQGNQAVCT